MTSEACFRLNLGLEYLQLFLHIIVLLIVTDNLEKIIPKERYSEEGKGQES